MQVSSLAEDSREQARRAAPRVSPEALSRPKAQPGLGLSCAFQSTSRERPRGASEFLSGGLARISKVRSAARFPRVSVAQESLAVGQAIVRERGLEPPRISTPEPKSGASASSATRAW